MNVATRGRLGAPPFERRACALGRGRGGGCEVFRAPPSLGRQLEARQRAGSRAASESTVVDALLATDLCLADPATPTSCGCGKKEWCAVSPLPLSGVRLKPGTIKKLHPWVAVDAVDEKHGGASRGCGRGKKITKLRATLGSASVCACRVRGRSMAMGEHEHGRCAPGRHKKSL